MTWSLLDWFCKVWRWRCADIRSAWRVGLKCWSRNCCTAIAGFVFLFSLLIPAVPLFVKSRQHVQCWNCWFLHSVTNLKVQRHIPFQKAWFSLNPLPLVYFPVDRCTGCCMSGWKILSHVMSYFFAPCRSKKDKAKAGVKPDSSDQEPEGLTLLVPDIQKTAEIVYAATTSLRQANQGEHTHSPISALAVCL